MTALRASYGMSSLTVRKSQCLLAVWTLAVTVDLAVTVTSDDVSDLLSDRLCFCQIEIIFGSSLINVLGEETEHAVNQ